jgi:TolB-like protein/Tfp pilus assembly protein PilF
VPNPSPARKTAPKKDGRWKGELAAGAIRSQLEDILASEEFIKSERLRRFLQLTVGWVLAGRAGQLKEYVLGRDVFDRGPSYDPRADSIVRVEARRLRAKLRRYYETHAAAPILIEFPQGSYVPVFLKKPAVAPESPGEPLPITSIAVLPFVNLGPDTDKDLLCEGITEAILHQLATSPDLRVVARTSAYHFQGKTGDVRKIGQILCAGTVVEGSVRKAGNQLRVSAMAVKTADGYSLWSGTFHRKVANVFAIQDEIASAVAHSLRLRLGSSAPTKVVSVEGYKLYLKGRHHWNAGRFEAAIADFGRARTLFPDYAPPQAGLAEAHGWLWALGLARPSEAVPKARQAAKEALRLDSRLSAAHVVLGALTCWHDWNWDQGAKQLRTALALEPSSAMALSYYGAQFVNRRRFAEATTLLERALHLDPLSVQTHWMLGWGCYLERQYDKAIEWIKRGLELSEGWRLRMLLGWAYLRQMKFAEAIEEFQKSLEEPAVNFALSGLGEAYGCSGKPRQARDVLERLKTLSQSTYVPATSQVYVYASLNDWDRAFDWLEQGYREHSTGLGALSTDERYDPVRADPRFKSLLNRLGLA